MKKTACSDILPLEEHPLFNDSRFKSTFFSLKTDGFSHYSEVSRNGNCFYTSLILSLLGNTKDIDVEKCKWLVKQLGLDEFVWEEYYEQFKDFLEERTELFEKIINDDKSKSYIDQPNRHLRQSVDHKEMNIAQDNQEQPNGLDTGGPVDMRATAQENLSRNQFNLDGNKRENLKNRDFNSDKSKERENHKKKQLSPDHYNMNDYHTYNRSAENTNIDQYTTDAINIENINERQSNNSHLKGFFTNHSENERILRTSDEIEMKISKTDDTRFKHSGGDEMGENFDTTTEENGQYNEKENSSVGSSTYFGDDIKMKHPALCQLPFNELTMFLKFVISGELTVHKDDYSPFLTMSVQEYISTVIQPMFRITDIVGMSAGARALGIRLAVYCKEGMEVFGPDADQKNIDIGILHSFDHFEPVFRLG